MRTLQLVVARVGWFLAGGAVVFLAMQGWERARTALGLVSGGPSPPPRDAAQPRHPADLAANRLSPWQTELHDRGEERGLDLVDWDDRPVIGARRHESGATEYNITAVFGLEQCAGRKQSGKSRARAMGPDVPR